MAIACRVPALHAQILGEVVDASSRPVANARVELWAPMRRMAVTLSDSAGGFQFASRGEAVGIVVRRLGGWAVAFCPTRGTRTTGIDGILTISADTLIAAASWNFRTPRPDEAAGGEVDFLPPELSQASLLLPLSSRFWRRSGAGRFYVQRAEYLEWRVHPGDRPVPLPREISDQGRSHH